MIIHIASISQCCWINSIKNVIYQCFFASRHFMYSLFVSLTLSLYIYICFIYRGPKGRVRPQPQAQVKPPHMIWMWRVPEISISLSCAGNTFEPLLQTANSMLAWLIPHISMAMVALGLRPDTLPTGKDRRPVKAFPIATLARLYFFVNKVPKHAFAHETDRHGY